MSWIIGSIGKGSPARDYSKSCPGEASATCNTDRIKIWAGGKSLTFRSGKMTSGAQFYILGYAALVDGSSYLGIDDQDWEAILNDESRIAKLDGHFLIVINDGTSLRIYNDPLGKRGLYIIESSTEIFFTSSLSILRQIKAPEIDFHALGVSWHTRFPPSNDSYTPSQSSYYQGVQTLGSGSIAVLGDHVSIKDSLLSPAAQAKDIYQLLESFSLLPAKQSMRMAIGLSGGMDIRPLLAVYLNAGVELTAVHYGLTDSMDYTIAQRIAGDYQIPFRHIGYDEAEGNNSWDQALDFMGDRGLCANPANAPYKGYYRIVSEFADCFVSGYFGELFRFRFFLAHLTSLFHLREPAYQDLAAYLYRIPPSIFQPEIQQQLHRGFRDNLRTSFDAMPSAKGMPKPMWFNLFLARYSPFSTIQPILGDLDNVLIDHMPWLQAEIIRQHWQHSFGSQLAEGIHRKLLKRNQASLESYPLALADISAPYYYRPYMVKLKMMAYYKTHPLTRDNRLDRFLQLNKEPILDLFLSSRVRNNEAYDLNRIESYLSRYYKGDGGYRNAVNSWLAFELGR